MLVNEPVLPLFEPPLLPQAPNISTNIMLKFVSIQHSNIYDTAFTNKGKTVHIMK